MTDETLSVLIVGGGPGGLTAALLLARAGLRPVLVERRPGTSVHPRARGLNVRTMEIFRALGLEEPIRNAGAALAASRYMLFVDTLVGEEIRRIPDDDLMLVGAELAAVTPCAWSMCAQDALEPLLLDAARTHGANVRFGTELVSFSQDDAGVTAMVRDRAGGAERTLHARYMIAADGAGGAVRQALAVAVTERGTPEHYVNIYFRADLSDLVRGREFGICFVENPAAAGLFLAVNNTDRWLFNVQYDPQMGESAADYSPERCIELVRRAVGLPQLAVEIISLLPWVSAARVAERFQVGRVFLVGDAAHTMPPAGGFGLNTAVQDAHNLAWKLAAVVRGGAAPALLDSYSAERQPVAWQTVERTLRERDAPTPDGPPESGPDETGDPMRDQLLPMLGYRYLSAAVVAPADAPPIAGLDLHGQPGTRLPHVWLERDGTRLSTLDLLGGHFVLLVGEQWATELPALDVPLDLYRIGSDLRDPDAVWLAANALPADGAILVRPDGFVGWRSDTMPHTTLAVALTQIVGAKKGV